MTSITELLHQMGQSLWLDASRARGLVCWPRGRGSTAIVVVCDDSEVRAITDYLMLEGGRPLSHSIDAASLTPDVYCDAAV